MSSRRVPLGSQGGKIMYFNNCVVYSLFPISKFLWHSSGTLGPEGNLRFPNTGIPPAILGDFRGPLGGPRDSSGAREAFEFVISAYT
jgi:hypothetical protein